MPASPKSFPKSPDVPQDAEYRDIIVAGYPKSGNTWVTRLVAELIGCPSAGYWPHNTADLAREGDDRHSAYRCFKSHHQFAQLRKMGLTDPRRIVYVLRDPRDVAISAAHYFFPDRLACLTRHLRRYPLITDLYRKTLYGGINTSSYRLRKSIHAVLFGDASVNSWCRVSWKEHVLGYSTNHAFIIRYEDMLCQPVHECQRILGHFQIDRPQLEVERVIAHQSFESRKSDFKNLGDKRRYNFMRKGTAGQLKQALAPAQIATFHRELSDEMKEFGYA